MAQSKIPAKCSECGLAGPTRKKAAKAGWVRKVGVKPDWLCPEHGEVWRREYKARLEAEDRELRARSGELLKRVPLLPLALSTALRRM